MNVRCFLVRLDPRGRGYRTLCRYQLKDDHKCPAMPGDFSYHNADSPLIDVVEDPPDPVSGCWRIEPHRSKALFPPTDPRWPQHCACGYVFTEDDERQVNIEHIYVDAAGKDRTLSESVPGMMWECPWYFDPARQMSELPLRLAQARQGNAMLSARYFEQHAAKRAPLVVVLPTGEHWCIDSKANNGPGWTCAGEPPDLICTPSIQSARWHGWLGSSGARRANSKPVERRPFAPAVTGSAPFPSPSRGSP